MGHVDRLINYYTTITCLILFKLRANSCSQFMLSKPIRIYQFEPPHDFMVYQEPPYSVASKDASDAPITALSTINS